MRFTQENRQVFKFVDLQLTHSVGKCKVAGSIPAGETNRSFGFHQRLPNQTSLPAVAKPL